MNQISTWVILFPNQALHREGVQSPELSLPGGHLLLGDPKQVGLAKGHHLPGSGAATSRGGEQSESARVKFVAQSLAQKCLINDRYQR